MATDALYKVVAEEILHAVDFTDLLPDDASVTASSAVTAVKSDGTADATVIGTVSQSGMELRAVLQAGTDGEDYTITFTARGNATSRDRSVVVEMRVRNELQGNE